MPDTPQGVTLDTWAPLSHKQLIETGESTPQGLAPSWVPASHWRRLNAYQLLHAYLKNVARAWLRDTDATRKAQHREYGDAALIRDAIRSAILGDGFRFLVEGADDDPGPEPREDDEEDTEGGDSGPSVEERRREHQERVAQLEEAQERQNWLEWWTDQERATLKVIETENHAVGLGDGVYLVAWSNEKGRVRLRTYDPGMYFPVYDDATDEGEFPRKVHLAWEWTDDEGQKWVRRITFELVRLDELPVGPDAPASIEQERSYPYAEDGETSRWVCLMSDGDWKWNDLGKRKVADLAETSAQWRLDDEGRPIQRLDLGIDFIPVVHVPNTINLSEMWGESSLLRVAQLLDDLAAADTDLAISGAITAAPPLVLSGVPAKAGATETYGPGQKMYVGDGKAELLDTSAALDALLKLIDHLLERLSVNRQLPSSVLGRLNPTEVPSGFALLLSFGPFKQLIEDYRLVRSDKYQLLAKFVQRLAIVGGSVGPEAQLPKGALPPGSKVLAAGMAFGSFLPADLEAVKALVVELVGAHLMSRATALRVLQEAGLDLAEIDRELDAIQREDFAGAAELGDALRDDEAARQYLKRPLPEPTQPAPNQPPPGPGNLLPTEPEPEPTQE